MRVRWSYLAASDVNYEGAVRVGPSLSGGGPLIPDLWQTARLWTGGAREPIATIGDRLTAERPDAFWVVAHNEGILVGLELLRRGDAPVHVTVQDDQEFGMYGRSKRYRLLSRLTRGPSRQLLRLASSVDVTSNGMRSYYRNLLGIDSIVAHPIESPLAGFASGFTRSAELCVGHIGNLYSVAEAYCFCTALAEVAKKRSQPARMVMIGNPGKSRRLESVAGITFEFTGNLSETASVERLSRCDFVYSMYPFDSGAEVFRTTSFPTKLTTYTAAQRPIFAHAPEGSTLAEYVGAWNLGKLCSILEPAAIADAIRQILALAIPPAQFEKAREQVFGTANATSLESLLLQTASSCPRVGPSSL